MKKQFLILSVCLLIILTCGCSSLSPKATRSSVSPYQKSTPEWAKIVKNNEIKIGVPTADATFDNQLIDAFANEAKLQVTKVVIPQGEPFLQAIEDGTVDMIWGQLPATSVSSSSFRLSNPYFHSTVAYISKVQDVQLTDEAVIGVLENSAESYIAEGVYPKVHLYRTEADLFYALASDQVSCVLYNKPLFEKSEYSKQALHIVKEVPCDLVVAFQHSNTSVATEVEKILAKIKADGTASAICKEWYSEDFITR